MKRICSLLFCLAFVSSALAQTQSGKASFYADKFEGSLTASGEKYKHSRLTAAHKSLPFGTKVRVTNTANSQSVEVVINDRGPYVEGRIIDLSRSAAEKLGFIHQGLADVNIVVIDPGDGKQKAESFLIDQVVVEEKEFYDFEIRRETPGGFGVQVGTYQELVNLLRLSDNLKNSYKKKVKVQVKVLNGIKYYSIILGEFSTKAKAADFLEEELKTKFPGSFVVEYAKLK